MDQNVSCIQKLQAIIDKCLNMQSLRSDEADGSVSIKQSLENYIVEAKKEGDDAGKLLFFVSGMKEVSDTIYKLIYLINSFTICCYSRLQVVISAGLFTMLFQSRSAVKTCQLRRDVSMRSNFPTTASSFALVEKTNACCSGRTEAKKCQHQVCWRNATLRLSTFWPLL